jgi:glycosyltransferase involved in cell wall biosynthesis
MSMHMWDQVEPPVPPPSSKSVWPWTEERNQQGGDPDPCVEWPRITIVTPSFNQGPYLEATIRSVLLQNYPNLEYIIIDGGSTDESVEIIRKYEQWLSYWVSEPDSGQADAINKGFAHATGDIYAWLNSDDIYKPCTLNLIGRYFTDHPECGMVYGEGDFIDEAGNYLYPCKWIQPWVRKRFTWKDFIFQPSTFWRREIWLRAGPLDPQYNWGLDWDWFLRATAVYTPHQLPIELSSWRVTPSNKSWDSDKRRRAELVRISRRYGGFWTPTNFIFLADSLEMYVEECFGRSPAARLVRFPVTKVKRLLRRQFRGQFQP